MSGTASRRLVHAGTALVLLVPLVTGWGVARLLVVAVAAIAFVVDGVRVLQPAVHRVLSGVLPLFRPEEERRLSGATWLWLGYALAVWLPAPGPLAGILVAAWADPAASLVGERFGVPGRKTLAGTLTAGAVACAVVLALGLPLAAVAAGSAVAAVVERWSGILDDNLLLPPAVALTVGYLA
ncbi:MAG: hypothetical protein ACE5PT_00410 [Gemmatimonadales bacterium]